MKKLQNFKIHDLREKFAIYWRSCTQPNRLRTELHELFLEPNKWLQNAFALHSTKQKKSTSAFMLAFASLNNQIITTLNIMGDFFF